MTSLITSTIARYAGAAEAIDELHAAAVAARDAVYTCADTSEIDALCAVWDAAERALSEAVGELLTLTIDGDAGIAPVAWVHRCAQIARIAGLTEAQVDDVCAAYDWGMGSAAQVEEINRLTNADLASWAAEVFGYELN